MYNPVFNNVADIQQMCNMVLDGYSQSNAGLLPLSLKSELDTYTETIIEGLEIAHDRLRKAEDGPEVDAEREMYMDLKRKCDDKIPGFSERTKNINIDEY